MKSKYLLMGLTFFLGLLLGYSFVFLNSFTAAIDYPPSESQSNFARACSELNGKELTLQNIEQLAGWSVVNGELHNPTDESVQRLRNGVDSFLTIHHQKQLDGAWMCGVGKNEGKIKSWVYYQFE